MLIFGIDKFMSEYRALVNFYGNAVATLVIAKWDDALDVDRARAVLATHTAPELSGDGRPQDGTGTTGSAEPPVGATEPAVADSRNTLVTHVR
jgi:aerobic C4-dicarboxylate transport protein